jgi:TonB family protein
MMLAILLNAALRMLLVGAVTWLALRVVRVRNPHVESLAWRMLLLAGLALPVLLYSGLTPSVATSLELPIVLNGSGNEQPSAATAPGATSPAAVFLTIYWVVTVLLLGRLAVGLMRMWRVAAVARPLPTGDDVRISPRLRSPATFGGIILLPAESHEWPAERFDAVLAHERAHVRSRDGHWAWLAQFHAAIFWFNPLAWWLRRRLETLAETTSDDAVVAARHDPIAYAALLLDFARQPNSRSVAMSVAESNVPGRIARLLARTPPGAELPRAAHWAAFAALIPVIFLAAFTAHAVAQVKPPASTAAQPVSATDAVRITRAADPDRFYPDAAKRANVSATVVLNVDVDPAGQVVDVQVLKPLPADDPYGFGAAAAEVARRSSYSNPRAGISSIKFQVKFAATAASPDAHVRIKSAADPDQLYPPAAKAARVSGAAIVEVAVDPQGQVMDVKVLEPLPANDPFGFGAAAVEVARRSEYSNPHAQISTLKFKVKFELKS